MAFTSAGLTSRARGSSAWALKKRSSETFKGSTSIKLITKQHFQCFWQIQSNDQLVNVCFIISFSTPASPKLNFLLQEKEKEHFQCRRRASLLRQSKPAKPSVRPLDAQKCLLSKCQSNSVPNTTHKQQCKHRNACIHTAHDSVAELTRFFGSQRKGESCWCCLRDSKGYSRSYSRQASDLSLKHSCTPVSHYRGCGAETMLHMQSFTYVWLQPVNDMKKWESDHDHESALHKQSTHQSKTDCPLISYQSYCLKAFKGYLAIFLSTEFSVTCTEVTEHNKALHDCGFDCRYSRTSFICITTFVNNDTDVYSLSFIFKLCKKFMPSHLESLGRFISNQATLLPGSHINCVTF